MWNYIHNKYELIKNIVGGIKKWMIDPLWQSKEIRDDIHQKTQEISNGFSSPAEHLEMWHSMNRSLKGRAAVKVFVKTNLKHGFFLIASYSIAKCCETLMPETEDYENQEDANYYLNSGALLLNGVYCLGRWSYWSLNLLLQSQMVLDNLVLLQCIVKGATEAEEKSNPVLFLQKKEQLSRDCNHDGCTTINQSLLTTPLSFLIANTIRSYCTGPVYAAAHITYLSFYIEDTYLALFKCAAHRTEFIENNKLYYMAIALEAYGLSTAITFFLDSIPFLSSEPLLNLIETFAVTYFVALSHFKKTPVGHKQANIFVSKIYIQCSEAILSSKFTKVLAHSFKDKMRSYLSSPPVLHSPQPLNELAVDVPEKNHILESLVHEVFIQPHKAIIDIMIDFYSGDIIQIVKYIEDYHKFLSKSGVEAFKNFMLSNEFTKCIVRSLVFPGAKWLTELLCELAKEPSRRESVLNKIKSYVFFEIDPLLSVCKDWKINEEGIDKLIQFFDQVRENQPDSCKEMNIQCRLFKQSKYYRQYILDKSARVLQYMSNSRIFEDETGKKGKLKVLMKEVIQRERDYLLETDSDTENNVEEQSTKIYSDSIEEKALIHRKIFLSDAANDLNRWFAYDNPVSRNRSHITMFSQESESAAEKYKNDTPLSAKSRDNPEDLALITNDEEDWAVIRAKSCT